MRRSRPAALSKILVLWAFCFLAVSSAQTNEPELDALVENGGYVITRNGRITAPNTSAIRAKAANTA